MKTHEFLETYPNAVQIITKHYVKVMQDSMSDDLPDNFKDYIEQRGFSIDELSNLIDANPRALIDVFDENDVHACLEMTFIDGKPQFGINIDGAVSEEKFANRKEAEKEMVLECIAFLEDKA